MGEKQEVLSLREAYRFGGERGLEPELAEIRDMEIEWDLSYTSSLRRGYVVDLFTNKKLLEEFVEKCWPVGTTAWGQHKREFWLGLKHRYENFLEGRGEGATESDEAETEQGFAAETDLRDYLAKNLACIEAGLQLYRQGERDGVEFPVEGGRIDLLAVDKTTRFMVFELKLARGRNKALGQLLYYMGWVDKHLGGAPCRGIIVAKEISDDLVLAAQRVQGVSLYRYKLNFSVEPVSGGR